ncbi:hypothetical protein P0D88_48935 [Paraburkholderia sp. RL18-103-BIB-C]|jgi:hypothetical protein|uniref:hypothetical protein n=1 Tax=Paraburkholderia sp. RL18-103-BIB-C TaxID=3031637 RepID=UPI0038B7212B
MDETPQVSHAAWDRDTGLGSEQVIDNSSSGTIAAHQRVGFAEKWLAARFAETQWGEHGDEPPALLILTTATNPTLFVALGPPSN